ncbi:sulfatase-like hydrolase/transferase [bacterium]|nr:sulfatase-like hydrolase/transferase [bacterium]MCI0605167.1 sulfatase-like hydrolase/transferase [bacterium]
MRKIVLIFAVIAALGVAGYFYFQKSARPAVVRNVLLITIDTLRADHLGIYGYAPAQTPNIDRLGEQGALFQNAIAVIPLTLPSHSSIMTGYNPYVHGVRDNGGFYLDDKAQTLAETMKASGFRTGGFISAFVLDRRWGIAQGFDEYFDNFELSKYKTVSLDSVQRRGDETLQQALNWISKNKDSRFFAWVHFYDPHTPYDPPDPFRSASNTKGNVGLYDGEISYSDNLIGRIREQLEQNDLLNTTLVILTADHGESLGEHEESGHGFFIYDATMRVPLIIRMPGAKPVRVKDQVRSIDLFATICDATGVSAKAGEGTSLMPLVHGRPMNKHLVAYSESYYPRFHYGWSELKALRTNEYKYIQAPDRELYRLTEDSTERLNLYTREQKRAQPFESELATMLANFATVKGPQTMDDDSLEKLQALGYIGYVAQTHTSESGILPDPKLKIRLYNRIKLAQSFSAEGKLTDAFNNIQRVLQEDDRILEAHLVLGNIYEKQKKHTLARESFQSALKYNADYVPAIFALARVYKEEGNFEAAKAGFQHLMQKDPRDSKAYFNLADIALDEKDFELALSYFKKVVELDPEQAISRNRLGACFVELKKYDAAIPELQKALQLNPRIPNAHFNLALVHEEHQDLEQAGTEYRKELELFPESYPANFNLSRVYRKQGRRLEERSELEACIRSKPDFGIAYLYLAKNLMDTGGDILQAKTFAEEGMQKLQEKSQLPFGHFLLADIYNRLGKPREAMQHVQQARAAAS